MKTIDEPCYWYSVYLSKDMSIFQDNIEDDVNKKETLPQAAQSLYWYMYIR